MAPGRLPDGDDVADELSLTQITVADSGDVYLDVGNVVNHKYLHFSPDGKRAGVEKAKLDDISEKWYDQPGTGRRWVLGYEKVLPGQRCWDCDPDHRTTSRQFLARQPGDRLGRGRWFHRIVSKARGSMGGGEVSVNLYSSQGDPIRTFALPHIIEWSFPRIAYNGNRLVIVDAKTIAALTPRAS